MNTNTNDNTPCAAPADAAAVETRRQAIMREPDFWKDGPKSAALRDEMKRITSTGDEVARPREGEQRRLDRERGAEQQREASRAPKSDAEKRLAEIRNSKEFWDFNHPKRPALMREYNALLAGMEEATQPEIREQMTTSEKRGEYGVEVKLAGGKQAEEKWNESREGDFYDIAHAWGLEAPLVRDVVHDYIQVAEGAGYQRIPDDVLDQLANKYVKSGRVSKEQAKALRKWYGSWFAQS